MMNQNSSLNGSASTMHLEKRKASHNIFSHKPHECSVTTNW